MYVVFPFNMIKKNSKVLIYGAGRAGKNFVAQIWTTKYCNVVAMIDRDYKNVFFGSVPIISINDIDNFEYDYIVISPIDQNTCKSIIRDLLEKGIEKKKIVDPEKKIIEWENPYFGFFDSKDEFEIKKNLQGYLEELDPKLLISSQRIDIIVRYLLFRDFMNGVKNDMHLSLYSRYVFCRTGGYEHSRYHSGIGKKTVEEFIQQGKQLCESIKNNGYYQEGFIPLNKNHRPLDGLHRIAAALAADEQIWIHQYNVEDSVDCDMKWFEEQGFSLDDQIEILRGFCDVFPGQLGMLVLYAPYRELWLYIEKQAELLFKVVGKVTIDFSGYYITFDNYIRQMYCDWNRGNEFLKRKYELLGTSELKFRIVIISDENQTDSLAFYEKIKYFKKKMRESLTYQIDSNVPIQLHSTDSKEEFIHLKKLFLSSNNILWEKRRTVQYYRETFTSSLEMLKGWCRGNHIDLDDVCIVGSGVMELYGLRDSNNINIIYRKQNHEMINTDAIPFEVMSDDYFLDEGGNVIPKDIVITQDSYHVVFSDVKFCNIEFVYRRKKKRMSKKDKIDMTLIENFLKYSSCMEDKELLQQQVKMELCRRGIR